MANHSRDLLLKLVEDRARKFFDYEHKYFDDTYSLMRVVYACSIMLENVDMIYITKKSFQN